MGIPDCSTSRAPSDAELEVLKKLLADEREAYKSDAEGTKKLLASGDSKIDEKLDAAEVAAWAAVCNALLNLDATIHAWLGVIAADGHRG